MEFASVCPLVAAVLRPAGVHFLFCFPAGMVISPQGAVNFVTLCPLAAAILHLAGVHFSFCISASMVISALGA